MHRVGIVGSGLMGAGIIEVCVCAGLDVVAVEPNTDQASRALNRLNRALDRSRHNTPAVGSPTEAGNFTFTKDLSALEDVDIVIEAVTEDLEVKLELFADLDRTVKRADAILASNTSAIPIGRLGAATSRPELVVGLHFFYPVPVLALVEVIPSLLTSPDVVDRAETFVRDVLKKKPVRAKDHAGFIVNRLLVPYLLNAVRMLESGFATREAIDEGMVHGCGYPMGPLTVLDLIGLDTLRLAAQLLYQEFGDPQFLVPPLLSRMVEAGRVGRKAGQGFYLYPPSPASDTGT